LDDEIGLYSLTSYSILTIVVGIMKKGSKQSEEAKLKMSEARKKNWEDPVYRERACDSRKHPKHSEEEKERRRQRMLGNKFREGLPCPEKAIPINTERIINLNISRRGIPLTNEHKQKLHDAVAGNKCHLYRHGQSFGKYCEKFNNNLKERVRAFFNHICQSCGKNQKENGEKLSVHHVYIEKLACCESKIEEMDEVRKRLPKEIARFGEQEFSQDEIIRIRMLVPVCRICHSKIGSNEEYEIETRKKFDELIMNEYSGKCYYTKEEFKFL